MRAFLPYCLMISLILPGILPAQDPDYFIPGDLSVTIEPPEARVGSSWRLMILDPSGNPVEQEEIWHSSGEVETGVPPGQHLVLFRPSRGWAEPDPILVYANNASTVNKTATFRRIPVYDSMEEIAPLEPRQGEVLSFLVNDGAQLETFDGHPLVERNLSLDNGLFTYLPQPEERKQFTVTFKNGGDERKTVLVNPSSNLPAEQSVITYRGDFPDPEAKAYLLKTEEESPTAISFNYRTQKVRTVTVSGPVVVFKRGHPNNLYRNYANASDQSITDVQEMVVYADRMEIHGELHLPSTNVTIYARELHFVDVEGEIGSLITTPIEKARDDLASTGAHGLKAGDITLNVETIHAPGGEIRLILKGGDGQNPTQGSNGANLSNPSRQIFTSYQAHPSVPDYPSSVTGRVIREIQRASCLGIVDQTIAGANSSYYSDANVCARSGKSATQSGLPGNGGDAGVLRAPFDLSPIANLSPGSDGTPGKATYGSLADRPLNAVFLQRDKGCFSWGDWYVARSCSNTDGKDYPTTRYAPGPAPVAGEMIANSPFDWIQPITIRAVLQYTKDAYLNGHLLAVRAWLEPYAAALEAYTDPPGEIAADLEQLRGEILNIILRLDNNLDYFGNPAGWVPMLSFEVAHQLFEDEVNSAMDVLYLTYFLGERAKTALERDSALSRVRSELTQEVTDFQSQLSATQLKIRNLKIEAESIDRDIRDRGRDLKAREKELEPDARRNVILKKALRVTGTVLTMVPVNQPALGLVGTSLTVASKWNEQSAIDSSIEGTNAAHEFLQTQTEESFEAFKEEAGDSTPPDSELKSTSLSAQDKMKLFDAGLVGVNKTLMEVKSYDSDMEKEVQILAAQDPLSRELVKKIKDLNSRKRLFFEKLAATVQTAKNLMSGIIRNYLALDSLNRDLVKLDKKIDQDAFRYIKEMEQRAKDRLLKFQYYMAKAFEYRTVRPYPGNFQLQYLYDFFQDSLEDTPGDSPSLGMADHAALVALFEDELRSIALDIIDDLIARPQEQSLPTFYTLTREQLDQLNTPPFTLSLNLVNLGISSQTQENVRISSLKVKSVKATAPVGFPQASTAILITHSGQSLISSQGETYKFNHYRTLETPPITWEAGYSPSIGELTNTAPSAAGGSLLESLLKEQPRYPARHETLLYSRPSAWADLVITKETQFSDLDMEIEELVLEIQIDFFRKKQHQADLEIKAEGLDREPLMPTTIVRNTDNNERGDGRGTFLRSYQAGQIIQLEAQEIYGGYLFERWIDRDGNEVEDPAIEVALPNPPSGSPTVTRYRAVYRYIGEIDPGGGETPYQRGDVNADGDLNLTDAVNLLNALFIGSVTITCDKAADVTDDTMLDLSDAIRLLNYLFIGGDDLSPPFKACGEDPTPDTLTCESYQACP